MNIEQIAKTCHEVNKAYCEANGDYSQLPWEQAPEWQKQSAVNGVQFHLDNPDSKPSDSHDNWLKEKIADGWVYGEKKDPEAKTHPCVIAYEYLPKEQKVKDYLFIAVVRSLQDQLKTGTVEEITSEAQEIDHIGYVLNVVATIKAMPTRQKDLAFQKLRELTKSF